MPTVGKKKFPCTKLVRPLQKKGQENWQTMKKKKRLLMAKTSKAVKKLGSKTQSETCNIKTSRVLKIGHASKKVYKKGRLLPQGWVTLQGLA